MARILYVGESSVQSTSRHRAGALSRLGHEVVIADPYSGIGTGRFGRLESALHFRTGYRLLQARVLRWLCGFLAVQAGGFDVVWVDSGELLGPECVSVLRNAGGHVVLYNHDDPTGRRDGQRFASLLAAVPNYDLCAVCRDVNVEEFKSLGARDVLRFVRGYDEDAHRGFESAADIADQFRSDVAFVGTWMRHERRDEFLLSLVKTGIRPAIWGGRWEKSPRWNELKMFHRGGPLAGRDYVAALQGAKICLGMLSKGNRDFSTTRSAEIPYAKGLLCAERTAEHQQMYREGIEAVFWSDAGECAERCVQLLADDALRASIRAAGHRRVLDLRIGNEDMCERILERVLA